MQLAASNITGIVIIRLDRRLTVILSRQAKGSSSFGKATIVRLTGSG
jgi:hypothetical protein